MNATIKGMEFKYADALCVDQLEIDDYVKIGSSIVQLIKIESLADSYLLTYLNDFEEEKTIEVSDSQMFNWYVIVDEELDI